MGHIMFMRERNHNHNRNPHIPMVAVCFLAGLLVGLTTGKKFQRGELGLQQISHYSILVLIALKLLNGNNLPQQMQASIGMVLGIVAGCVVSLNYAETYTKHPVIRLR
jgi:hypothetical protein